MKIYYSDAHLQHNPPFEIFDGGEKVANFEVPQRVERILEALRLDGRFDILPPDDFGLDPIRAVHDEGYLSFLETAFDEWMSTPLDADYERSALLPATFPPAGCRNHIPKSLLGRAGYYIMDLSAPIVAGTYQAALASAHCALSGAKFISPSASPTFCICIMPPSRPPRRARQLRRILLHQQRRRRRPLVNPIREGRPARHRLPRRERHARYFLQSFRCLNNFHPRRPELRISLLQRLPRRNRRGRWTRLSPQLPAPTWADDQTYLATLDEALKIISGYTPKLLIISAGMDIYGDDPLGKIRVSTEGIARIGKRIAGLNLPTLVVMEGGYNNAALGTNIVSFLQAFHQ